MTDAERIEALERRLADFELRMAARVETVIEAMAATAAVTVDALALVAVRDRELVENLLRLRRLAHQQKGSPPVTAELIKRYELALETADLLVKARPLGPQ